VGSPFFAKASKGILLCLQEGVQILRSPAGEAGWR
jgi:hypothetical protein